jgi:hypothetical protein
LTIVDTPVSFAACAKFTVAWIRPGLTGPTKVSSIDTFHCCADCIDVEEVANTTSAPSLSNADERFPLTEEEFEKVRQLIWEVTISELNIRWREDLQKG